MRSLCFRLGVVAILASMASCKIAVAAPPPEYGKVELVTDTWGIPHAFSETDEGAFYALGWATAQERGFQMTYSLRIMQGRLSETVGRLKMAARNETSVDSDRKARTFGWTVAARRAARGLDRATRKLQEAYSEGVNDSFAEQKRLGRLHPLFAEMGCEPDRWTVESCLLSWWRLAQFFAGDGTRDLLASRNRNNPDLPRAPQATERWIDDAAAVVRRPDVSDAWVARVRAFAAQNGFAGASADAATGPKMSHAWVVGGLRSTSGSAVLVSDPQTPVRDPSLLQEFHICGKTINARGVGVPGSPVILIGFNTRVAWGMTALGADQADLYMLETDAARPLRYRWNGEWRDMTLRRETIAVRGEEPVGLEVRECHLGPIVNEFAFRAPGDADVALKRVPICDTAPDTVVGAIRMMRARTADEFQQACAGWRFPTANCVFGDTDGHIGYTAIGGFPIRPSSAPDPNGGLAIVGRGDRDDWRGYVPADLVPCVTDPQSGAIWSANHRPIQAFYPIPLGVSTGSMGDTMRSWRLSELLAGDTKLTPEQVLAMHFDATNPARRAIVRLAIHIRDSGQSGLSQAALGALKVLEPWLVGGTVKVHQK